MREDPGLAALPARIRSRAALSDGGVGTRRTGVGQETGLSLGFWFSATRFQVQR